MSQSVNKVHVISDLKQCLRRWKLDNREPEFFQISPEQWEAFKNGRMISLLIDDDKVAILEMSYKTPPPLADRRVQKHWTQEEVEKLKKDQANGLSVTMIAQKEGLSYNTIYGVLYRNES